ncbi:MAG: hypothetical protein K0R98_1987 [Rickettsiaceae bacterium]|jgi:hypothetical protein|nr:hypothetical protein [Rickettsiaceae bacterium]
MDTNSKDKHEKAYNDIIKFYDFAEELLDTVESPEVQDPVAQLEFVEPLVEKIENATDILAEEYRNFIKSGKISGFMTKKRVEKSLKRINEALIECQNINDSN